jgi:hypothetical protein
MSEQVKDFRYYAEQAERQIQLSLGHEADGTRLLIDSEAKVRHVMRAQVYATLATGAASQGERCWAVKVNPGPYMRTLRCERPAGHEGSHIDTGTAF